MAASKEGTTESEIAAEHDLSSFLSTHLTVSRDSVLQIASGGDEASKVLTKVQEYIEGQGKLQAKWRAEMTGLRRARVNAEQQFSQIEKQLITCSTKLETEIKQHARDKQELEETSSLLAEKQKRLQEMEGIKDDASTNYSRISKLNEQLEAEKLDLLALVERKNQEIDNLNVEWKTMSEKVSTANTAKCKAEAALDEIQSQGTSFKFKEKRLEQEKELIQKQNEWLNTELKTKVDELTAIRKDKSSQVLQLQSQLDTTTEELKHLKQSNEDLQKSNKDLEEKAKTFMERLKETRDQLVKTEEHFKNELASQSRLADLYKDEAEDTKKKCKDMLTAMEELQKLVKEASDARLDVESRLQEQESSSLQTQKELENKIQSLEKELENANDLLQAARGRGVAPMTEETLSALSPTAAATSSLLKSGMTLTQIYSQYVEVSDGLQQEKLENTRLNNYLDQILKEIEEKAPMLQQQKYDYEKALHSVDQLTRRMDTARVEHEQLLVESDEARKLSGHLKRENQRLKTLNADLSQQVQVLLKECEEARGGIVSTSDTSVPEVSSSSQVISQHLVTFKNIEELQQQNQKLLAVIRDLSEDKEKKETESSGTVLTELKSQLDISIKEVENMKEARTRQMSMVEAVVRQRDMYRVLLANTGQSPIPVSQFEESSMLGLAPSTPDKSLAALQETKDALKEMQKHFTEYRTEKKQEEKKLMANFEKQQEENTHLMGEKAKLKSQLEFSEERYKMLQSNSEGFKKEANAASAKAQKLNLANAKMQLSLDSMQQNMAELKDRLTKAEVTSENLKAEKQMLRDAETRLLQENKTLLQQHKDQSSLLINLQSLQNKLERSEFDTRTRLQAQVDALQKEATMAKRKLEAEESHYKNIIRTLENRVEELKTQIDTESRSNHQARDLLVANTKEMEKLEFKCAEAKAQLEAAEKRVQDVLTKEPSDVEDVEHVRKTLQEEFQMTLQDREMKIKDAEAKVKDLEAQLQQAKAHADQFKAMSGANEEALRELNTTSEEFKAQMQSRVNSAEDQASFLQGQVHGLENGARTLRLENERIKREAEKQTKELQEILATIRKELEDTRMHTRSASANELLAKEELKEQAKLASECQEKYERELMLHANDVQSLTAAKEELQGHNKALTEVTDRAKSAEQKLKESQNSWQEQKKQHEVAIKKMESRCADLVTQNSNLHRQLDKLVNQMASTKQTSLTLPPSAPGDASASEEGKSTEELWEVLRFIRRDKEIAETKCELAQTESLRYQQRAEFLEQQLKNAKANLQEEKTQTQVDVQTSAQHAEVMEKVKKLNEVTQANKVLTDEKQKLEQRVKAVESKLKSVESQLQPLRESNRTLTTTKDALVAEKTALKNEIMRWTTRSNQLAEQYKNVDPEEYKRMQEEKKQFQQHVGNLKGENSRTKSQLESVKTELSKTQTELTSLKAEQQKATSQMEALKSQTKTDEGKVQSEMEALKKTLSEKSDEISEKIKTLNQVKRIARRYKTQFDEQTKEMAELKKKMEEQPQQGAGETPTAPPETATAAPATTESVDLSSYENKIKELEEKVQSLEGETREQQEQMKALKESEEQVKAQLKEKEDKSKKVLIQAREKIQNLTATKDKLTAENEELRKMAKAASDAKESLSQRSSELEMRMQVLQSTYDSRLANYEKDLEEARSQRADNVEKTKKQIEELETKQKTELEQLQQRVQQQQKQIQQQQMKLTSLNAAANNAARPAGENQGAENNQAHETTPSSSAPPISAVPPTATIKPTTTPTVIKSSAAKTASIRPMTQTTPTATVLPTVTPTAQETPTTSTAIVPPRGQAFVVSTAASASVAVRPVATTSAAQPSTEAPSTGTGAGEIQPAGTEAAASREIPLEQSAVAVAATSTSGKRQRDEEGESTSSQETNKEPTSKKLKTVETEAPSERQEEVVLEEWATFEVPDIEVGAETGRETPEVVLIESDDEEEEEEEGDEKEYEEYDEEGEEELDEGEEMMEEEEEEDEDEEELEEEDYEEEDLGEDEEEDLEEMEGETDTPTVDVVEVLDDDEEEEMQQQSTQERGQEVAEQQREEAPDESTEAAAVEQEVAGIMREAAPSQADAPERQDSGERAPLPQTSTRVLTPSAGTSTQFLPQQDEPSPSGRLSATDRSGRLRSHLAPFSFPPGQGAPGPFDEADDCTVPSTPTLFVPKRTDGFAEAISSPHIHRPFNFAPPNESSNSGMQSLGLESSISEGGLRVDDTHVDLMEETSEENSNSRPPFSVTSGSHEAADTVSQTVPVQAPPSQPGEATSRQPSLESLESEGDYTADVTTVSDVPSITVTPATAEETAEQNVPVAQETAASLEQEVIELTEVEGEEGNDDEEDDKELEEELEEEIQEGETQESAAGAAAEITSSTETSSTTTTVETQASTSQLASKSSRGSVIQLRRPAASGRGQGTTHSGRGSGPAQGGRARRIKRFTPGRGSSRGRSTAIRRGGSGPGTGATQ